MITWTIAAIASFSLNLQAFEPPMHPDPEKTSGDYCSTDDPDFREYRYRENVPTCIRSVSRELKTKIYQEYGVPRRCRGQYTVDHFIPLSMGGSNQAINLWPEHKDIKATRQNLELDMYIELREGRVTQRQAIQRVIREKMNPPHVDPRDCRLAKAPPQMDLANIEHSENNHTENNPVDPKVPETEPSH